MDKQTTSWRELLQCLNRLNCIFQNEAHGDAFSGHPERLNDKMRRYTYWPDMKRDVGTKVRTCLVCQAFRSSGFKISVAKLHPLPVARNPRIVIKKWPNIFWVANSMLLIF